MGKKYGTLPADIIKLVGGKENIKSAMHCQTRLRFDLADEQKADRERLKALEGVASVLVANGQFQVVIGTNVAEVYDELSPLLGDLSGAKSEEKKSDKRKNPISMFLNFITNVFQPILPAIAGAGMLRSVLTLLVIFNVVSDQSQTYILINIIADAMFMFLPFFLANSVAKRMNCTPVLAMGLAGMLLHPTFTALVAAGDPVSFFGVPVTLVGYASSMFPIIMIVVLQSFIEKGLNKVIPNSLKLITVPMITLLIAGFFGLTVLGPIGTFIGNGFLAFFQMVLNYAPWVLPFLLAVLWPIMVMFGIHVPVATISPIQFAAEGFETNIGPAAMVSNIAQGTAALVASIHMKNSKDRQMAVSTGITGLMGVTEPVLYGIALPKKYPLIAGMIGSAAGGLYCGINHVARYGVGHSGLPAIPLYIGDDISNLYNILIAIAITMVISGVLSFFFSLKFEKKAMAEVQNSESTETPTIEAQSAAASDESNLSGETVLAPAAGEVLPLEKAQDEAFATGVLGQGAVIVPTDGKIVAPVDGTITTIPDTKHAIGILSQHGAELLIHVGLDTVKLNGKFFESHVSEGDTVKVGQLLLTFNLEEIRKAGYSLQTPVVVTNADDYKDVSVTAQTAIKPGEGLFATEV